jgi:hypothetical protein
MALYYDLPVFKDVYQLILKIFEYTKDFPREYKYTLGQELKRDGINLVRSIYRANKSKNKVEYLETFLDDFDERGLSDIQIASYGAYKENGFSVRCLRD